MENRFEEDLLIGDFISMFEKEENDINFY